MNFKEEMLEYYLRFSEHEMAFRGYEMPFRNCEMPFQIDEMAFRYHKKEVFCSVILRLNSKSLRLNL
ncbi:MAG: hypothetical protein PHD62_00720 [Bacteroidales bacterium]|nr:hypothetical protein [Bacteroidales bacterium]